MRIALASDLHLEFGDINLKNDGNADVLILSGDICTVKVFRSGQKKAKQDLVLDFFAGSGTTAAVAHKMGRKWITIEQMDYIEGTALGRINKVIEGNRIKA